MKRLVAGIMILVAGTLAMGQVKGEGSGRIVTTTRLVARFSQLESQWEKAVQDKDAKGISGALGEEFQVWMPLQDPIPREDFLKQKQEETLVSFRIQHMAVRSLSDEISVASFVLTETVQQGGKPVTKQRFLVDVWRKQGEQWQVTDRYESPLSKATGSQEKDIRPSGKN